MKLKRDIFILFLISVGVLNLNGNPRLKSLHAQMDLNENHLVSAKEFLDFWQQRFKARDRDGEQCQSDKIYGTKVMQQVDANRDGPVSAAEDQALRRIHFKSLDKNADGNVSVAKMLGLDEASPAKADFEANRQAVSGLAELRTVPKMQSANRYASSRELRAIYFDGLDYMGKKTKFFAWLGLPEQSKGTVPGIVLVHGGGGTAFKRWVERWTDRGYAAISIAVEDAKSAIRFLHKNMMRLKIDPNCTVAAGGSAGGHLAAVTAMITSPETNDTSYDTALSCIPNVVILCNPYLKYTPELSPPNFIGAGLPPVITFLGESDPAITVKSLLDFHKSYRRAGKVSEYFVGKEGKHGFCNGRNPRNSYFYWSLELQDAFLVKHGLLTEKPQVNSLIFNS